MHARKTLVACALAAAFAAPQAQAVYPFDSPAIHTVGTNPRVVVRLDLYGTGEPIHLATANSGSNDVMLLVNDGKGQYTPKRIPVGVEPGRINVVDFNNDGRPDLAVLNQGDKSVHVLVNDGNGGFTTARVLGVGERPNRQFTWKAGANSYLVVSNHDEDTISYFAFGADGGVIGAKTLPVGDSPNAIQNADVNGDGVDELLVVNYADSSVSVVEREADAAGLPTRVARHVKVGAGPNALTGPFDLDGDGKLDALTVNTAGDSVSLLLGNGDGTFGVRTYAVGETPIAVNAIDVDRDGKRDIVASNFGGDTISVLINEGNGRFAAAFDYVVGRGPGFPISTDVNGDGIADLVVAATEEGSITVLEGLAEGGYVPFARIPLNAAVSTRGAPQIVDVAHDGNPGIAVALTNDHSVAVVRNLDGGFVRLVEYARTRADGSTGYFITPIAAEIEALDFGRFSGWARTGETFRAYARPQADRNPVCRFFSPSLDAHFYTADPKECENVTKSFGDTWGAPESHALFHIPVSSGGQCPAGLTKVYRLHDPVAVAHRYTHEKSIRDAMAKAGWLPEGDGADGVAMCAP